MTSPAFMMWHLKKEEQDRKKKHEEDMILSLSRRGMTQIEIRKYMDNYRSRKIDGKSLDEMKQLCIRYTYTITDFAGKEIDWV